MATLASRTKELSGLHSGTLAAHLLAITQGTGTGVDRLVFVNRSMVCATTQEARVASIPSENMVATKAARPQALYPAVRDEQNSVAVLLPPNEVFVARSMWRMTVMAAKARQCVVTG